MQVGTQVTNSDNNTDPSSRMVPFDPFENSYYLNPSENLGAILVFPGRPALPSLVVSIFQLIDVQW